MKRCMSNNVCFNFYSDSDIKIDIDTRMSARCEYDVYVIFAECFSEDELTSKIDLAERLVYSCVCCKKYTDDEVKEEIERCLNNVYLGMDPVIDVVIKKRKFPVESTETGRNEVSMEG